MVPVEYEAAARVHGSWAALFSSSAMREFLPTLGQKCLYRGARP